MKTDPVISPGVLKAALVFLVAAAIGGGGYALAGGELDLPDLPDLPDVSTTDDVKNLENTTVDEGTFGQEGDESEATDPFTTDAFSAAVATVLAETGPGAQLTRLFVNEVQTQFIVRRGDGVEAYSVRADGGDLVRDEATITISGNATIADFTYSLAGIKADAVGRMLAQARKLSGPEDFRPTVLTLERAIPFGSRRLEWTINAEGGGRNLVYKARADGSGVHNVGGRGPIPEAAQEARRLGDCIAEAGDDTNAVFACLEKFQ